MAPNNGGVWKTTDFGHTWTPIFDDQPTGSIGALAVAPSNSNIIYVGSGEGLRRPDLSVGDGIYKSADAGKTWQHLGLRDAQQIAAVLVDPHDPNRVFVAAVGHPYGPNPERGIYRSLDGGQSWEPFGDSDDADLSNSRIQNILYGPPGVVLAIDEQGMVYQRLLSRNVDEGWERLAFSQPYGEQRHDSAG